MRIKPRRSPRPRTIFRLLQIDETVIADQIMSRSNHAHDQRDNVLLRFTAESNQVGTPSLPLQHFSNFFF
jgi:hypothetical protein